MRAMKIRIESKATELHDAIDAAWEQEQMPPEWYDQTPGCPECGGDHLGESGKCFDCSARDYETGDLR